MNKKQKQEMKNKIVSVEETVKILKLQESNLLEAIRLHPADHPSVQVWVHELFIGADYIVRLENSIKIMKESIKNRRKSGGKEEDE